ncbi:hypothetical protein ElyMa_003327200 [Elysia marginata]|uniref:PH domain-containing protein n=1 Tax=Elysia marginata TaxID=1093978 RepID=A0AAV4JG24_9GAST|nr:hypothetical protein ElyMa_003327200 [Elysia marginata]
MNAPGDEGQSHWEEKLISLVNSRLGWYSRAARPQIVWMCVRECVLVSEGLGKITGGEKSLEQNVRVYDKGRLLFQIETTLSVDSRKNLRLGHHFLACVLFKHKQLLLNSPRGDKPDCRA